MENRGTGIESRQRRGTMIGIPHNGTKCLAVLERKDQGRFSSKTSTHGPNSQAI